MSDFLAAERTYLAWIRTGMALMGIGFVIARFGLFLQALQADLVNPALRSTGLSLWLGAGFIILGVIVAILSSWNHVQLVGRLRRSDAIDRRPSRLAIGVAATVAAAGLATAVYLIAVPPPTAKKNSFRKEHSMSSDSNAGIVTVPTTHSVDETVQKLVDMLQAKGVKLFAVIDHSGEAEKAGLSMPPTKLVIFGNPKAGTPVMLAAATAAIDLPLKILVREDGSGGVQISYNSPEYLQTRHGIPQELMPNLAVVATLVAAAAK